MAAKQTSLTNEDKVSKALAYKEEGNQHFKKKEYKKAVRKYHHALLYLKGVGQKHPMTGEQESLSEELEKQSEDLRFGCYNNLAACLTKEEKWERALEYCNQALEINPDNAKALFRKGLACYNVKDWDKAFEAFQSARKLEPNDPNIMKYQAALEQQLKKHREKEKVIYAGMFNK